jgi:antitoxin (DNA-binding transcriptional repressor) of toxin-antitoxin stability system
MQFVNIHDAKTNLSRYIDNIIGQHETIIICKNGKPVAQLTAYKLPVARKIGLLKGKIKIESDFDELPQDFKGYFE